MNDIIYKTGTATKNDILLHLTACNNNFIPALNSRVDLSEYAEKISVHAITFEAWFQKNIIGLVAMYLNENDKSGFITNVSVSKEFMGKGIASELLKKCVSYVVKSELEGVKLEVNRNNLPAIELYKKYNFIIGELLNDSLYMKLTIKK